MGRPVWGESDQIGANGISQTLSEINSKRVLERNRSSNEPVAAWRWGVALALLLGIGSVYFASGHVYISHPDPTNEIESPNPGVQDQFIGIDCFSVNDSSAVIAQSLSLINDGDLTVRGSEGHHLFDWAITGMEVAGGFPLPAIDDRLRDWIEAGTLRPVRRYPQLVETTLPGVTVNCFGMGGAITAVPGFAIGQWMFGPLNRLPGILDRIAFTQGAVLVAMSASLLFLAWSRSVGIGSATVLTIAYAFGTCVYSTSSQGMWQHSATALYMGVAILILSRGSDRPADGYLLGLAMAMATLSRPTMGITAALLGVQLLLTDRRTFVRYTLAGLPFAAMLLYTNYTLLGSPWRFGQTVLVDHAMEKTGVAKIWQTPILTGLAGLLVSPSRGLFVFSPFLLGVIPGAVLCWLNPQWRWMRSFSLAVLATIVVESRHFDWWGGWSFGYRHLVDLSPMLVTLMLPLASWVGRNVRAGSLALILMLVSVGIQIVGVVSNDIWRWNASVILLLRNAEGTVVKKTRSYAELERWISQPGQSGEPEIRNVDRVEYRDRLWSWRDQPIEYYVSHFKQSTLSRQAQMWNARQSYERKLATSYRNIAIASATADGSSLMQAATAIEWALTIDPGYQEGWLTAWTIFVNHDRKIDRFISFLRRQCLLDPNDRAARVYLGLALVEQGSLLAASETLAEVLRQDLGDFERRLEMARTVFNRRIGEQPLARSSSLVQSDLAVLDKLVKLQVQARRAELAGKWEESLRSYEEIERILPGASSSYANEARIHWRKGDTEQAWSILRGRPTETQP